MWLVLVVIVVALYALSKYLTPSGEYFEKRGIPYAKPMFLVGSRSDIIWRNRSLPESILNLYNEFYNDK
jgi:hypothetical protein